MNPAVVQTSMLIAWAVIGTVIGNLLYRLADFLPRYATTQVSHPPLHDKFRIAIQLLTGLVLVYFWGRFGFSATFFMQSLIACFLILIAVIDLKYRLILNVMIFPAVALVLVRDAVAGANLFAVLIGGVFGLCLFLLAAFVRPGELGGGDVKLATLIGLFFAFPNVIWALLIGILAGGVAAIFLLTTRRAGAKSLMPYAPFLCFGALIMMVYNSLGTI